MVDVREKRYGNAILSSDTGVRVTFADVSASDRVHEAAQLAFTDSIHLIEEHVSETGIVVSHVVESVPVEAHPRPVSRRKTPREIFEDSKARFPNIMARLAE